jgi:hypothetical protein
VEHLKEEKGPHVLVGNNNNETGGIPLAVLTSWDILWERFDHPDVLLCNPSCINDPMDIVKYLYGNH